MTTSRLKGLPPVGLLPEVEFLLACARCEMQPADVDRARSAARQIADWSRLVRLAVAHRLLPLLHRHVASGAVEVPATVRPDIDAANHASIGRALLCAVGVVELLERFEREQITAMPLKGPVLAGTVYGSIALRAPGDLDFLIHAADLQRAADVLRRVGYVPKIAAPIDAALATYNHHEIGFVSASGRPAVELHFALLPPAGRRRWTLDALAADTECVNFMNRSVAWLRPETLFVYLCEHGAGHTWSRLEWLAAVGELVRRRQIADGARLRETAARFDAQRRVDAALDLVVRLLDPQSDLTHEVDWRSRRANDAIVRRLTREPERVYHRLSEALVYMFLTDLSVTAGFHRCWSAVMLPTPTDLPARAVPPLGPATIIYRPLAVVRRKIARRWPR